MTTPIFVINLANSTERWSNTQNRFAEYGIEVQRLDAVYGAALNDAERNSVYSSLINQRQYHRPLSNGEIGCYASHRKSWQAIIESGHEYGIVVEDDITLSSNITAVLTELDALTFDWDLIKLAPYQNRTRKIRYHHRLTQDLALGIHEKPLPGCAAYAISRDAARKLLASTHPFGRPVDSDLQHTWEHNIDIYAMLPFAIHQDMAYDSDIGPTRKPNVPRHRFRRIKQQFISYWRNRKATTAAIERLKHKLSP